MELPPTSELIQEYERHRLPLLRELAYKSNNIIYDKLTEGPITSPAGIITNPLIEDIDNKDADYLFFALWDRVISQIVDIKIPPQAGYGIIYDEEFKGFTPRIQKTDDNYKFSNDWLPYLMLKNPDKLWIAYHIVFELGRKETEDLLLELKDGHQQERQFTKWINEIEEQEDLTKISKGIVDMMLDEKIDVLDSIYILVKYTAGTEFSAFIKYI